MIRYLSNGSIYRILTNDLREQATHPLVTVVNKLLSIAKLPPLTASEFDDDDHESLADAIQSRLTSSQMPLASNRLSLPVRRQATGRRTDAEVEASLLERGVTPNWSPRHKLTSK